MLSLRLLRSLLPPGERDEILADLEAEYADRRTRDGRFASRGRRQSAM